MEYNANGHTAIIVAVIRYEPVIAALRAYCVTLLYCHNDSNSHDETKIAHTATTKVITQPTRQEKQRNNHVNKFARKAQSELSTTMYEE